MPYTGSYFRKRRAPRKSLIFRTGKKQSIMVKPVRGKKVSSALARKIKSISLAQSETKVASTLHTGLQLGHNNTLFALNLMKSAQSDRNNPGNNEYENRIGNEIVARGLKLRVQLINAPTKANVTYKWFLFRYPSGKAMTDADFWVGPSGQGATQNRMIDFIDTREVKILKSGIVRTAHKTANMNQSTNYTNATHPYILGTAQDGSTPGMHSTYFDIWYSFGNRKIKYDGNNSTVPKFTDIGLAVVPYDVNNTPQGTLLGYLDFTHRFYFKDP